MLFHTLIGFPKELIVPKKELTLKYSQHAIGRFRERNHDLRPLLASLIISKKKCIEIKTPINKKKIIICVIRYQYNKKEDIIFVLKPNFKKGKAKVITLWINKKNYYKDKIIKKSNYSKP